MKCRWNYGGNGTSICSTHFISQKKIKMTNMCASRLYFIKASFRYIQQHKNRKTELQAQCVVYILQDHCYLWGLEYYINTNFNKYMEGELP